MKIVLHPKFLKEKTYVLNCILDYFLGVKFQIITDEQVEGYSIQLKNGNSILISDNFFKYLSEDNYLTEKNIPSEVFYLQTPFNNVRSIPILFGSNQYKFIKESKIKINSDIIASTFFMLTRWEEHVIKERDTHQRFSAKSSISYKFGFLNRPIVNEYVELLWSMLVHLGIDQERKKRTFQIIPTHDVDLPRLWWNFKDFVKTIGGRMIKKNPIEGVSFFAKSYLKKIRTGQDPFDTFDYLMQLSEKNNLTSHFFFMSGGTSDKDNYYSIKHPVIVNLIKEIKDRGHQIGFHPSYNAYNDSKQFALEKSLLEEVTQQPIVCGRQHFLRFEVPKTWQIWEQNKMNWDSTMSYADHEGFRCGVCYPFPVFDILERKELNLIERPLIIMDGSLVSYQDLTPEDAYNKVNKLLREVKKYNGEFIFLWHNSAFNTLQWLPFQNIYKRILDENSNNFS